MEFYFPDAARLYGSGCRKAHDASHAICHNRHLHLVYGRNAEASNLAKIKIKDDRTGNILHVNVMGVEAFKYTYLENSAKNPCGQNITIPKEINKISPVVMEDIKQSCKKKMKRSMH